MEASNDFVLLITAENETHAAMFREILSENGIDSYSKTRGMGSCYSISNLLSVDIYVLESCLDRANSLLSGLTGQNAERVRIYLPFLAEKPIRRLKRLRDHVIIKR